MIVFSCLLYISLPTCFSIPSLYDNINKANMIFSHSFQTEQINKICKHRVYLISVDILSNETVAIRFVTKHKFEITNPNFTFLVHTGKFINANANLLNPLFHVYILRWRLVGQSQSYNVFELHATAGPLTTFLFGFKSKYIQ